MLIESHESYIVLVVETDTYVDAYWDQFIYLFMNTIGFFFMMFNI